MAKRRSSTASGLPYLTDRQIEEEAALLLAEFGNKYGPVSTPPIPIDDIVELHLDLTLEFKDMQALFGVGDVHGALWVKQKKVGIDIGLDPSQYPTKLGRYRFTLAHEAGHWRLHRELFQDRVNQLLLLPESVDRPEYICRSSDRDPIEIQANKFAAALLMPREMLARVWHEWRGSMDPIYLDDLMAKRREFLWAELMRRHTGKLDNEGIAKSLLEQAVRPLAKKFEVSAEAMRIRLEGMGLLLRKRETTLFT
ncbi:MAG: hypothetical protein KatS3mg109_0661 [Pirellulaceae bacterium]|nr:MAG: hypothetical protein KatS3mg109_0661 [Pirellulaceae bacterium]